MKKKLKVSFRTFGKIGFLLMVIGFFMPVMSKGIEGSGLEIAKYLNKFDKTAIFAILVYVALAAAAVGGCVGVLLLLKNKIKVYVDWICLLACIGSGLIVYFKLVDLIKPTLQTGGYIILIGWVIALATQIISKLNKEA